MKRALIWLACLVLVLVAGIFVAFQVSPWPTVLLIRHSFDKGAIEASDALIRHVPQGVTELIGEVVDPADPDALIDVFRPPGVGNEQLLPAVVWVHGGAYVYGRRDNVSNYLKVLAGQGFATVAVGYSKAPSKHYPTPLLQLNGALEFLRREGPRLGIDPSRIVLAGDSAGAQIVAQYANIVTAPDYAARVGITPAIDPASLKGVILHCGPYGVDKLNFDGAFGGFITTILWAYFGDKNFLDDPRLKDFSVVANMTKGFPPVFISVGNADPLAPLSLELKAKADELGVPNEAVLFPADYQPPLGHEYQFNLDGEAGRLALDRTVAFLKARLEATPPP